MQVSANQTCPQTLRAGLALAALLGSAKVLNFLCSNGSRKKRAGPTLSGKSEWLDFSRRIAIPSKDLRGIAVEAVKIRPLGFTGQSWKRICASHRCFRLNLGDL
jgi:hypothetical protein